MANDLNRPSLSELLQAYNAPNQAGSSITSLQAGFNEGQKQASEAETRKLAFQQKLEELGIAKAKEAREKDQFDADYMQGDKLNPLVPKDKEGKPVAQFDPTTRYHRSVLGDVKAPSDPSKFMRPQFKGLTQNGQPVSYDPSTGAMSLPDGAPYDPTAHGELQPAVKTQEPASSVDKRTGLQSLADLANRAEQNFDPSFVGMVDSRMQGLKQLTGFGASAKAAEFKRSISDIKDTILRMRSGASINEQEYQRLLEVVPNDARSEVDFRASMKMFKERLNEIMASRQQALQQGGYRAGNIPSTVTPQGTTTPPPASGGANNDPLGIL